MLSDEEMKAIEDLKDMIEKSKDLMEEEFYKLATIHNIQAVATILNLIKKQSKEIEELKENNKNLEDELNKYIVKLSDEQYRRLVDIIRDEINKLWEDKIKAKIEEVDYKMIAHQDVREAVKQVLQSLLEKET